MIRDAIKEAMKLRKVKQKDLADFAGVTKGTMSAFLAGRINLGLDKIEMIFRFLNIELAIKHSGEGEQVQVFSDKRAY